VGILSALSDIATALRPMTWPTRCPYRASIRSSRQAHHKGLEMNQQTKTRQRLQLDEAGLAAAKRDTGDGAVTPAYGPWREDIVKLLNDALATELTCVLRYRRHHFTATGRASPAIADEFLVHANDELRHADKLAERIVQLNGEPDFRPETLPGRSHADYDESLDLTAMIKANLVAERVAIEAYRQTIGLIGDKDPSTRRLLEEILTDEEEHADELKDWLER
jgi:bacterioferritin